MSNLVPLPNLTHFRFRGPDAERYLNGQVTQQVEGIIEGQSRYTFVCDGKGRILFDATIHRDQEGLLLSAEGGSADDIFARMDRYLIADDCELIDETNKWLVLHELSSDSPVEGLVNRFGTPGRDIYQNSDTLDKVKDLATKLASQTDQENYRITNGIPRTVDLLGALPAETGIEELAVSFHKGCYLGQEVISRMKRAAKTNRKLCPIFLEQLPAELPLSFTAEGSEKKLLEVTSTSSEKTESGYPALGYLSSRHEQGTQLISSGGIVATPNRETT